MAKKKAVKKAKQLPLVEKAEKKGSVRPPQATLVSFTVSAVIPTQQYGNIQPKIEVTAKTIEDARAFVMPVIESLYKQYAETPLNGKEPKFLGNVTETVKVVTPPAAQTTVVSTPQATAAAPEAASTNTAAKPKTEAVLKAEKAIGLAQSEDAMLAIQEQIEKSTKIAPEDKPELLKLCLKRRGELAK